MRCCPSAVVEVAEPERRLAPPLGFRAGSFRALGVVAPPSRPGSLFRRLPRWGSTAACDRHDFARNRDETSAEHA
eukprot:11413847-Alexandrium_andersonii.AAC.1